MKSGPCTLVVAPSEYPGKKYASRYVYEHHLIWWQSSGTVVPEGHVVHHKNGNKRDNRIENLELLSRGDHTSEHTNDKYPRPRQEIACICGKCGSQFFLIPRNYKTRIKKSKTGTLFCSEKCAGSGSDRRENSPDKPDGFSHGTPSGYTYHGCRCELCTKANTDRAIRYREKLKEKSRSEDPTVGW